MAEVEDWIREIRGIARRYDNLLIPLHPKQMDIKFSKRTWSINQIFHHLALFNESHVEIFNQLKFGVYMQPYFARHHFIARYFAKNIQKGMDVKNEKKLVTYREWDPMKYKPSPNAYKAYKYTMKRLLDHLAFMYLYTDISYVIHYPPNSNLMIPIDMAVEIIILHERKHQQQITEMIAKIIDGSAHDYRS